MVTFIVIISATTKYINWIEKDINCLDNLTLMRPYGGKQNFRIGYLTGKRTQTLGVKKDTAILIVKRFLHFEPIENAIYSELYCRTDRFVFFTDTRRNCR